MEENIKNWAIGIFFLLLGAIITLVSVLLPKWIVFIILIVILIILWIIYDRFIVNIMDWKYIWWSPHIKKINLKPIIKENFNPEIAMMSYFIEREYNRYQKIPLKDKFLLAGVKGKCKIVAKYSKNDFEVRFYPLISKDSITLMKDFEKYISNLKITDN